jgi:hypothetical protein
LRTRILVGATQSEEKFFKKLGGKLLAAVDNPEQAINLIMKQFEQRRADHVGEAPSWGGI